MPEFVRILVRHDQGHLPVGPVRLFRIGRKSAESGPSGPVLSGPDQSGPMSDDESTMRLASSGSIPQLDDRRTGRAAAPPGRTSERQSGNRAVAPGGPGPQGHGAASRQTPSAAIAGPDIPVAPSGPALLGDAVNTLTHISKASVSIPTLLPGAPDIAEFSYDIDRASWNVAELPDLDSPNTVVLAFGASEMIEHLAVFESLRLRYGVFIHSGPKDTLPDIPSAWADYISLTQRKHSVNN